MIALSFVLVALQATGSRGAVDTLGRGSWLIDEENDEVLLAEPMQVLQRVKVDRWPEQLAVDAKGRVFVTCREGNALDVIGTDLKVQRVPVGPEPRALALDEEHGRVYVGTATGQSLHALELDTLEHLAERKLDGPVAALAVTPAGLAAVSERAGEVWFFPLSLIGAGEHRKLDGMKAEVQPQWLVPHGDDLLVVSRAVDTGLDAPSSSGGYGGNDVGLHQLVVHALRGLSKSIPPAPFETARLPDLPDASSVALFGSRLLISSRTGDVVMHVNADTLRGHVIYALGDFPSQRPADDVDFPANSLIARGVAAAAFTANGELLLIQPAPRALRWLRLPEPVPVDSRFPAHDSGSVSAASRLPESALDPELRLGRALFHDGTNERLSGRRMACALCHLDGREDGLVWQQNGTFRQTPMLAGGRLKETAPYNWLGTAHTLEANIHQTVTQRLAGEGLRRAELRALARYVRDGLRPVQRPETEHRALVAEGKAVFERADVGCASCHPADFAFTDGAQHDIQSIGHGEREAFGTSHPPQLLKKPMLGFPFDPRLARPPRTPSRFNTPSLTFVGMTAPYLHDGSAPTLEALIENNHDRMGTTSQLSLAEREALVAYLQSL